MNWIHSCKKVAQLLSQRLDEPLGFVDSLRLRLHLSMCDNCRNVQGQLVTVNSLAAELFESDREFNGAGDRSGASGPAAPAEPSASRPTSAQ